MILKIIFVLKAEFNSIFFLHSILSIYHDKSTLIKTILDENTLHVFINQVYNLSLLFSKFNQINYSFVELGSLLFPSYDPLDQNKNNICRTVYYSGLLYQLLIANIGHYHKQKLSNKAKLLKSITCLLNNQQFLNRFSKKYSKTIIDLEKCLLYICTHNETISNDVQQVNTFDIFFNIGTNYENCSKESFLILTQTINVDRMNKIAEKLSRYMYEFSKEVEKANKADLRNYLYLIYFILQNPKRFDLEKTSLLKTTLKYQDTLVDFVQLALSSDQFEFSANFDFENNLFDDKIDKKLSIFFYVFHLVCFTLENTNFQDQHSLNVNKCFSLFQLVIRNKKLVNQPSYIDMVNKSTNIMSLMLKYDSAKREIKIDSESAQAVLDLVLFLAKSQPALKPNEKKEQIIENLIHIQCNLIEYDRTLVNIYVESIESYISDLTAGSLEENLKLIYHFRENHSFSVYSKSNFIITYNMLVLIEFTKKSSLDEYTKVS